MNTHTDTHLYVHTCEEHNWNTITYQMIAGALICFSHLTDQAFIWDQAANFLPHKNSSSLLSLTVVYICFAIALIILWDTLMASPFADNPFLHVYVRLLASLSPFAVLLRQTLKLSFIFSPISHSLGVDRETSSSCFSRVFFCIFYDKVWISSCTFYFFAAPEPGDHQCDTDWQKASTICEKCEEVKRA